MSFLVISNGNDIGLNLTPTTASPPTAPSLQCLAEDSERVGEASRRSLTSKGIKLLCILESNPFGQNNREAPRGYSMQLSVVHKLYWMNYSKITVKHKGTAFVQLKISDYKDTQELRSIVCAR